MSGSDERVELQRAERAARRRGVALVFVVAAAVVGVLGVTLVGSHGEPGRGCSADARLGPNGQSYGRDPARNCHFIDEDGNDLGG